jgi:uncharacterized membrane protein
MMLAKAALQLLPWLIYPLAIFFGLRLTEPRYVAAVLAIALLLRQRRQAAKILAGLTRVDLSVVAGLLALAATTTVTNSELLLRLYPVAVNAGMLLVFGTSLAYPPSMIERFARLSEPALGPAAIVYTRQVTRIWCAFFVANGAVAGYTALYASRDAWALYNGLIAYLLMGSLFAGEWIYRRFHLSRTAT